jgi:hypothetical protein
MAISRRSILRYGLFGAGLLAVGGVGLGLRPGTVRLPARPLKALDERGFSTLAALADRVNPGGGGAPAAHELQVAEKIDDLLATCDPGLTAEISQALALFENAVTGLLFDGRPTPFSAATPEQQDAAIESWRTSRLHLRRQVYKALRTLCASTYYASPESWASVGYPGPPDLSGFPVPDQTSEDAAAGVPG